MFQIFRSKTPAPTPKAEITPTKNGRFALRSEGLYKTYSRERDARRAALRMGLSV